VIRAREVAEVRLFNTGEWRRQDLMRLILGLFLIYMLLFWVTNWVLWFTKFSFDPAAVAAYFRGDPANEFGAPPRPVEAMAEASHVHLFAMGMLLLTLTHLVIFLPLAMRVKGTLVVGTFLCALLEQGSGWLIRFGGAGFAWLKIGSFVALQVVLLGLLAALLAGVLRPMPPGASEPATPHGLVQGPRP
jgi:hypothetical protein